MAERGPRAAVVRVLAADGATAGAGFLVAADGLVVTCAHVVGEPRPVQVQFPDAPPQAARVSIWRDASREDVAFLELLGPVPGDIEPLGLRRAAAGSGRRMRTYGFPAAMGETGMWGYGTIGDLVTDATGLTVLQLAGALETTSGFSGGPVIDESSGLVVGMVSSITPQDRYGRQGETAFATPSEVLRELWPPLAAAEVCPYRGLERFEVADRPFFHGRASTTRRLIGALAAEPRFLAVLGPSGSGKSSVLRAGLAAELADGALAGSGEWTVTYTRPAESGPDPRRLSELAAGPVDGSRHVLVLDQFEEVFGFGEDAVRGWGDELLRLLRTDGHSLVIAMRDDFYSRLAADLPTLMNTWVLPNLVNVPAVLERADLVDIIRRPAEHVGLRLEPGLTEAIVADAAAAHGGQIRSTLLPLVQFALTQLWQRQDDGLLRRAVFEEFGGVAGGLVRWADATYYGLSADARPVARRLLTMLTRLGDEAYGTPHSRRRRELGELTSGDPLAAEVLGALVAARLVATGRSDDGGPTWAELIHETLLREWQLLETWLREDREFLTWQQALEARLRSWSGDAGADVDWLQGRELDRAEHYLAARAIDLDARQRSFIQGSAQTRQERIERDAELNRRAERERAEAERQRQIAQTREITEQLRADAEAAAGLLAFDPALALASAIAVTGANTDQLGGAPLAAVQANLFSVVRTARERRRLAGHRNLVTCVAADPAGEWLISGSRDCTVRRWEVRGDGTSIVLGEHDDAVNAVAVSADGSLVASGSGDGTVRLCRPDGTEASPPVQVTDEAVLSLAFHEAHGWLAVGCGDGLYLWTDPIGGAPPTRVDGRSFAAAVAFTAARLVVGYGNGDVVEYRGIPSEASGSLLVDNPLQDGLVTAVRPTPTLQVAWATAERAVMLATPGHAGRELPTGTTHRRGFVTALAASADGSALFVADEDGAVHVRDRFGSPVMRSLLTDGPVTGVVVRPDGRWIAGAAGRHVYLWDWVPYPLRVSEPDREPPGPGVWDGDGYQVAPASAGHDFVASVAFDRDGQSIVTVGGDRCLRLWDVNGRLRAEVRDAHEGGIVAVACAPAGFPLIASGGRDMVVRLFDMAGHPVGRPFEGHTSDVMAVAFRPDGELVATGARDGTVRLWTPGGQPAVAPIDSHGGEVLGVAFSPDGRLIAATGEDGLVRLYDLDGRPHSEPFVGHAALAWDVAFSPDGETVLSCGSDRTVRRSDRLGRPLGPPMRAHTGGVRAGRFHPAGAPIVTVGDDGAMRTWTSDGAQLTPPFTGHRGPVSALAVSPDGRLAATGGDDGTLRVWHLGNWRDWLREGCERLAAHSLSTVDLDETTETGRIAHAARAVARTVLAEEVSR